MSSGIRYTFYGLLGTAGLAFSAAGGLAAAGAIGITSIGAVPLSQLPAQLMLEWQLWTATATATGSAVSTYGDRTISFFHRGTLQLGGGQISRVLELSTARTRAIVEGLRPGQPGGVIEFRIPLNVFERWEVQGLISTLGEKQRCQESLFGS